MNIITDEATLVAGITPLSVQTKDKAFGTTKAERQKDQDTENVNINEVGNTMAIEALAISGHSQDPRYPNEKSGTAGSILAYTIFIHM